MRDKKFLLIFLILFSTSIKSQNLKIGLFDTTNLEKYKYQTFIDLAKSVGLQIDYKSMSEIIDNSNNLNLSKYKGILFIIDLEFLKGMVKNSQIALKMLKIMKKFNNKKKLIGLLLPTILGGKIKNKVNLFSPIFNALNIQTMQTTKTFNYISNSFFIIVNNFLNIPLEIRGSSYHTTLSNPKKLNLNRIPPVHTKFITTLPIKPIINDQTLPYGIYWSNPVNETKIFITSNSLLSFAGISENFHYCPTNYKLRLQMLKNIQIMLQDLKNILLTNDINNRSLLRNIDLPKSIKKIGNPIKKKNKQYFKKIAWIDINIFEKKDKVSKKKQRKLINSILASGSDLTLWLTLNPHTYYSPIASKKNKETIFIKSLKKFTKSLKKKSKNLKMKTPKILIGFEIANNLYPPNYPKNCAFDIYGNQYFDIPNPINFNFWKQEIINSLKTFMNKWYIPQINNGIKIAGIVLDLEMYCRKTSNIFLSTIGFNPINIKKYNNKNLAYLIKNKQIKKYYDFLEKKANYIGKKIKQKVEKNIPNGIVICYAPNISTNWFYKGFYQGLSSSNKPIQLLTFNSEFNSHQKWLKKNKIFTNHSSVLMLSKIKNKSDFWWIDKKLKHHHGIWFNKFSRLSEKKHNNWTSIEQSPMNTKDQISFFKKLYNKK